MRSSTSTGVIRGGARQIVSPQMIPTMVREAFRIAQEERPGPVHLELPEDIAAEECQEMALIAPHQLELPRGHARQECSRQRLDVLAARTQRRDFDRHDA